MTISQPCFPMLPPKCINMQQLTVGKYNLVLEGVYKSTIIVASVQFQARMLLQWNLSVTTTSLQMSLHNDDNRVGQSREIYSNSVPLSPPHWPYPKRIRPPSWTRVAVASSIQNTKLFTWRTWPGAGAVPKCDWAARSPNSGAPITQSTYIWYVATHGQSVITTELMIA